MISKTFLLDVQYCDINIKVEVKIIKHLYFSKTRLEMA